MSESKVTSGKHNLGSAVDLRMKVRSPFGKHNLGSAVDLRVKVFSPLGGHKQNDTVTASTSGPGTSRSSRGGGEGRSCRGGVEEAAEMRLNNLAGIRVFIYLMGLEV